MPRDASGTYTLPINSFYPAQANTDIDPNDAIETLSDIAAGLTDSALPDLSNVPAGSVQPITLAFDSTGATGAAEAGLGNVPAPAFIANVGYATPEKCGYAGGPDVSAALQLAWSDGYPVLLNNMYPLVSPLIKPAFACHLRGTNKFGTGLYLTTAASAVVQLDDRDVDGFTTNAMGSVWENLKIDARQLGTFGVNRLATRGMVMRDLFITNALHIDFWSGSVGLPDFENIHESLLIYSSFADGPYNPANALPLYNLYVNGSDSHFTDIICAYASTSNVYDNGGENYYANVHAYGVLPYVAPQYGFVFSGSVKGVNLCADGGTVAGFYFGTGTGQDLSMVTSQAFPSALQLGNGAASFRFDGCVVKGITDPTQVVTNLGSTLDPDSIIDGIVMTGVAPGTPAPLIQRGARAAGAIASGPGCKAFGRNSYATGKDSTVFGQHATDRGDTGRLAFSSGQFTNSGDAQGSLGVLRATTTSATPVRLTSDGLAATLNNTFSPPLAGAYFLDIMIIATCTSYDQAAYRVQALVGDHGDPAAMTIQGGPQTPTAVAQTGWPSTHWSCTVDADIILGTLAITASGVGPDGEAVNWVARISSVEAGV